MSDKQEFLSETQFFEPAQGEGEKLCEVCNRVCVPGVDCPCGADCKCKEKKG